MLLKDTLDALAAVFFPAPCRICGETLASATLIPICQECLAEIQPIRGAKCELCGRPFASAVAMEALEPLCFECRKGTYSFERTRSYSVYNDIVGGAVVLLKYDAVTRMGAWFAARLESIVREDFPGREFDVVVPVPLHPARLRERGYNQAELIARPLARRLGLKLGGFLLVRTKPRPPRLLLTSSERWETVRGAYETRQGVKVDKLRILLVDDVFTTGATLDACARALLAAGAASVCGVTVARVVPELSGFEPDSPSTASNFEAPS
ncbi:MAG: ComF family protein [Candidatus Acidiferrales bacterium]